MACQSCEERRQAMKAYMAKLAEQTRHWIRVRAGEFDAKPTADVQANTAESPEAHAQDSGQASEAGATNGQQAMATDTGSDTDSGWVQMPSVRKAGNGSKRTR